MIVDDDSDDFLSLKCYLKDSAFSVVELIRKGIMAGFELTWHLREIDDGGGGDGWLYFSKVLLLR